MLSFQTRQEPLTRGQVALMITPNGSIDKKSYKQFERQMEDYLRVGYRFLIINCSYIKIINSTGLQIMVKVLEEFQGVGGILLFINVSATISKFFDMLGFSPVFTSFTNQNEAVAFLNKQIDEIYQDPPPVTQIVTPGQAPAQTPAQPPPTPARSQAKPPTASFTRPPTTPSANKHHTPGPTQTQHLAYHKPAPSAKFNTPQRDAQESVQIHLKADYYARMNTFDLFPMEVTITPADPKKNNNLDDSFNIIPYFPGCMVIPEYRILALGEDTNKTTFWVTPIAGKSSDGWIEIWREEDSVQSIQINCLIRRQTWAKRFVIAAFIMPFLPAVFNDLALPSFLQFLAPAIDQIQQWGIGTVFIGSAVALLSLAIMTFLKNKPKRTQREFRVTL